MKRGKIAEESPPARNRNGNKTAAFPLSAGHPFFSIRGRKSENRKIRFPENNGRKMSGTRFMIGSVFDIRHDSTAERFAGNIRRNRKRNAADILHEIRRNRKGRPMTSGRNFEKMQIGTPPTSSMIRGKIRKAAEGHPARFSTKRRKAARRNPAQNPPRSTSCRGESALTSCKYEEHDRRPLHARMKQKAAANFMQEGRITRPLYRIIHTQSFIRWTS